MIVKLTTKCNAVFPFFLLKMVIASTQSAVHAIIYYYYCIIHYSFQNTRRCCFGRPEGAAVNSFALEAKLPFFRWHRKNFHRIKTIFILTLRSIFSFLNRFQVISFCGSYILNISYKK